MNRLVIYALIFVLCNSVKAQNTFDKQGALVRSDTLQKNIYLCFTGHDYYEGFDFVLKALKSNKIKASFFFTGDFVRNHSYLVKSIINQGHYVGAHSDKHLLYCDWNKRDSLLFSENDIKEDISNNLKLLKDLGSHANYFMPPYEWYNEKVVQIAREINLTTVNYSSGTRSNADYTTPEMSNYVTSDAILKNIYEFERLYGMNGFHLLIHPGTNPLRTDKLYLHLEELISYLMNKGYNFKTF